MQKYSHTSSTLNIPKHKTSTNSLFGSSNYQNYHLGKRKHSSKNSSSADFNERLKYVQKIYRNLSEKRASNSKSLQRSSSPKYNPASKYKNSGFYIPTKFMLKPKQPQQKKLTLTTANTNSHKKNWITNPQNMLNQQLRKIKFSILAFTQRAPELLKIKNQANYLANYQSLLIKFYQTLECYSSESFLDQKQNKENILYNFYDCICRCEEKKNQFKNKVFYESINKLEQEKKMLAIKNKELTMKREFLQREFNQLRERNGKLMNQIGKIKGKVKVSVEVQTDGQMQKEKEKEKEKEKGESSNMIALIQQLRELKKKQEKYIQVIRILQYEGINIQSVIKKYQNNHTEGSTRKYPPLTSNNNYYEPSSSQNSSFPNSQHLLTAQNPNQQSFADCSIISSMQAISFNYKDKQMQPEIYSQRIHHQCQKQIDQGMKDQLHLNFSCLYTDYQGQFQEEDLEDGEDQFGEMRNKGCSKEGCPTI